MANVNDLWSLSEDGPAGPWVVAGALRYDDVTGEANRVSVTENTCPYDLRFTFEAPGKTPFVTVLTARRTLNGRNIPAGWNVQTLGYRMEVLL